MGKVHITRPLAPERWQELRDEGFTVVVDYNAQEFAQLWAEQAAEVD